MHHHDEAQTNLERYGKSTFAGMIRGWIDEWMRCGMPESPDEIALLSAVKSLFRNIRYDIYAVAQREKRRAWFVYLPSVFPVYVLYLQL